MAWVLSDELDLVGDLWADVALPAGVRHSIFFGVDSRTSIERAQSDLTFGLRDLQSDLRAGWRDERRGWTAFAGRRGRGAVDASGDAYVRYLAAGWETPGFRRYAADGARVRGRLAAGPVLAEHGVEAEAVVFGAAHGRLWRFGRRGPSVEFDLGLDGLWHDGRLLADASAGPRLAFPVAGGRRASLFAHYQRSRNPLGLGDDAWLLGFAYEEGRPPAEGAVPLPDIDGRMALAGGAGRTAGRLVLRFVSPAFLGGTRVSFLVDGNILTGDDVNELYYRYDLGLRREAGGMLVGAYFYHRSNHTLNSPNPRITSLNVLEAGIETPGWPAPAKAPRGHLRFDGSFRAGWLIDSTFGEDRRWNVRAGARLALSELAGRLVPYLLAEAETGDVSNHTLAVGAAVSPRVEIQLESREDDQWFGSDDSAVLLGVRYGL